ncbi:hypothetical protein [Pantoea sp. CTOTU46764]|uniref:hypothetical protein n=1 Tax=Pantoea sp. CTOTU46764 TaxID=2953854 RepID=UPI00289F08A2|nr:hypothetical protein [Pantoea sp. CTOTU46764]
MPAGLQCWDATGKMVVDIGDYNTRYLGRASASIDTNAAQLFVPFSGSTLIGCFAVIVGAQSNTPGLGADSYEFAARCLNGGVQVIRVGGPKSVTLTLDVYAFI